MTDRNIRTLADLFGRVDILNLPERQDRLKATRRELRRLGFNVDSPKVRVPYAPRPTNNNGLHSRGVYGSFLSHLQSIRDARRDGLHSLWVLEDDACFSQRLIGQQSPIADFLVDTVWDMCFFGHSLECSSSPGGPPFIRSSEPFMWAHCYAVHSRVFDRLIQYLEETLSRPPGHPEGGRVYIDGAYNLFRRFNSDVVCLVSSPCLCIQRGSPSNLNTAKWFDRSPFVRPLTQAARTLRDTCWRYGLYTKNSGQLRGRDSNTLSVQCKT
jgi:glycosyl transferase family 25